LPAAFAGFRVAHLTDLHVGDHVPLWYMRHAMHRVNALRPDLVVVTGDLVHHTLAGVKPVTELLAMLDAPVIASLGNHDYDDDQGGGGGPIRRDFIAVALQDHLAARGIPVLRNRATSIERGENRLWIAGLEDYYTDRFSPAQAFSAVPAGEPAIVLSHNPDTAFFFESFNAPLILSGHTHGGQVRIPFYGPPILPLAHRELDQGLHTVNQSRIYISRGVGYLRRIRFNCRPELACLRLQPDGA
jgi:predicted MPP superfamily phosphohydrolase